MPLQCFNYLTWFSSGGLRLSFSSFQQMSVWLFFFFFSLGVWRRWKQMRCFDVHIKDYSNQETCHIMVVLSLKRWNIEHYNHPASWQWVLMHSHRACRFPEASGSSFRYSCNTQGPWWNVIQYIWLCSCVFASGGLKYMSVILKLFV